MSRGMTCTRCFLLTDTELRTMGMNVGALIALCENWLCDDCLDQIDYEAIEEGKHPPSLSREGCQLSCCKELS